MTTVAPQPFDFSQRPPSAQWEPVLLLQQPAVTGWVWFKPINFPQGLILLLPEQIDRNDPRIQPQLTVRRLTFALGIAGEQVLSWSVNGMHFEGQHGQNPLLDHPLPPGVAGVDPGIYVSLQPVQLTAPVPQPMYGFDPQFQQQAGFPQHGGMPVGMAGAMAARNASVGQNRAATTAELEIIDSIQAEWTTSLQMESELGRQRKQLVDMQAKLKSLNRDLNTDERTYSSSQDKKDWQDARRWLRDCSGSLARCLKEYDIGFTSRAGQRTWFEETYENFIVPRLPFDGMQQAHADFQIYHKQLQALNSAMKTGLQHSQLNGERRAQRILSAIAAKVRDGNSRNSFLGVITGN